MSEDDSTASRPEPQPKVAVSSPCDDQGCLDRFTPACPPAPWPRYVMLELTNACDLACLHCPLHGSGVEKLRPIGRMPESMWRTAVDEVGSWDADVVLQPWGMGEPLLHPQIWEVVRAAKRFPKLEVGFYSNGNQWRAADVTEAFEAGLDWICLSIDGVRGEIFERYRVGASFERVIATLESLQAERGARGVDRPLIRVNMVRYPELEDHVGEALAVLGRHADEVMVSRFRPVGDRSFAPTDVARLPCYQLDTMLAVASDGRVVQCCEDQQGQAAVGWFPQSSLAEIWRGEPLARLRRLHREGRWGECPMCGRCDGWTGVHETRGRVGDVVVRERTSGIIYEGARREVPS